MMSSKPSDAASTASAELVPKAGAAHDVVIEPVSAQNDNVYPPDGKGNSGDPEKVTQMSPYGPHVFADGGRKAWLTVLGGWLVMFGTFGLVSAFGIFEDYYVLVYRKKASDIAWIGSLQLCLMFTMGPVVGKPFDEGYFHHLMVTGSTIYVFGIFMLSLADPAHYYQIFLSQGVTCGLGLGLVFLPTMSVLSHHFLRRRALAVGIAFTGSSVGGIVFPIMLNNLFQPTSIGFANAVRVAACIVAVAMIAGNLLMRTDVPPRKKRAVQIPLPNPIHFFRDRDYVVGLIALSLMSFAIYFTIFYIQIDSTVHGVNSNLSFYTLTILNAFSIPGRLLPNFAADRFGILNATIVVSASCAVVILGMLGIKFNGVAAVILIAILYGFFSGALLSLLGAVVPSFSRSVHEIGMRTGIVFFFMGICGLLGTPIDGWLLGSNPLTYRWWRPIVFSAVLMFSGSMLLIFARFDVAKRRGSNLV